MIFSEKSKNESVLPPERQVNIILETQEEIDQLFAMLNHRLTTKAINAESNDWSDLRQGLPNTDDYLFWHSRLCGNC